MTTLLEEKQAAQAAEASMTDSLSEAAHRPFVSELKRGRQLTSLQQQSIPPTICFQHLREPEDYLQPVVIVNV